MKIRPILLEAFFTLTVLSVSPALAQQKECKVEVTTPKMGDTVRPTGQIRGVASVPPGGFLWVFVHKEGLSNWWPQGRAVHVKSDGTWIVAATYGDEANPSKDEGETFEITAVVVDDTENTRLNNYVSMTERQNRYPGTQLPPAAQNGCTLKENVIVTHQ